MTNQTTYLRLASLALLPALAACGGGGGASPDLPVGNGLPYADGTHAVGAAFLEEGDRLNTRATGVRLTLEDQLVSAPISIERVDARHLQVSFNGESYLLEQVGSEASTGYANAAMSIDFGLSPYDEVSLARLVYLGDGGVSASLVAGYLTDAADVPTSGTMMYQGMAYMDEIGGMGVHSEETWQLAMEADFDEGHITALFTTPFGFVIAPETPFDANGFTAELHAPGGLSGSMDGAFYAQNGEVIAGNVHLTGGLTFGGVYSADRD